MRYFLLLLLLMIVVNSFSQDYTRVNAGFGLGYVYGGDYTAGLLLYLEPSYRINNRISFGLRLEGLMGELEGRFSGTGSYSLNAKYYFLNGRFQPFAGLGAGAYYTSPGFREKCDCNRSFEPVAGIYPRIGFAYGHLIFNVEYNIQATAKMRTSTGIPGVNGAPATTYIRANYMSTKIGFIIGGGRRIKSNH